MAVESSEIQRGEYLPRVADGLLTQALQSSGAVQIKGPKWCGKTATAERQSASQVFMQDPDRSATLLALADTKPSLILRGEEPRLIDEWQMAPQLWDAVRFAIDRGARSWPIHPNWIGDSSTGTSSFRSGKNCPINHAYHVLI